MHFSPGRWTSNGPGSVLWTVGLWGGNTGFWTCFCFSLVLGLRWPSTHSNTDHGGGAGVLSHFTRPVPCHGPEEKHLLGGMSLQTKLPALEGVRCFSSWLLYISEMSTCPRVTGHGELTVKFIFRAVWHLWAKFGCEVPVRSWVLGNL